MPAALLVEAHPLAHATHRLRGKLATVRRATIERGPHLITVAAQFFGPPANRYQLTLHGLMEHAFAINAPPARRRTLRRDVLHRLGRTERPVKVINVTNLRCAGIGSLDALGVGDRGAQLLPHFLG